MNGKHNDECVKGTNINNRKFAFVGQRYSI